MPVTSDPIFGINLDFDLGSDGHKSATDFNLAMIATMLPKVVESAAITTPPGTPIAFTIHIVPATGATGAWASNGNKLACRFLGAWHFVTPWLGAEFYNKATGTKIAWNGTAWV